jgi:methyl-accepting chemotaxis protein
MFVMRLRMTIGMRSCAVLALSVIAGVAATTASNFWLASRMTMRAAENELRVLDEFFLGAIRDESERALAMADAMALNTAVQNAFAARDRAKLAEMLVPGFAQLKRDHAVVQLQFHIPPATSFLRVHAPQKFGDDLSSFRFTVVEANRTKKPIFGLEYGVEGLGIRGVVPVFRGADHIGSVEVGTSFGQPFLDEFKRRTGAEVVFLLKTPEGLRRFASTLPTLPEVDDAAWTAALTQKSGVMRAAVGGVAHALVLSPVVNYRGDAIGVRLVAVDLSVFTAALSRARLVSIGVGGLVLAITLVFGSLMNRGIVRPLRTLAAGMRRLAAGEFDILLPGLGRGDEIGEIAGAVETFKANAIEKGQRDVEEREAQARAARQAVMHELAGRFEAAVGHVVAALSLATAELTGAAGTLTQTAETTQRLSNAAAATSEQASANVQSVACATEELTSSVQEISRQVCESSRIADEAVEQAHKTDARIAELSQAASRIGDVVKLITAIAAQTNLLALNATIEAARAGEAGRGFAVVAQEVKALALQTAKATGEIGTQISGIQAVTRESVRAIKDIGVTIARISEIAQSVAAAVEQQGAATGEIASNAQQAARGTAGVVANVTDVNRGAAATGCASAQVLASAQSLARESDVLKREVADFLASVRAA